MKPEDRENEKEHNEAKSHKVHKGKVEELQKRLDELQKEKDDIFAQLQRVSADYANYQKRSVRQIADSISYEKEKIIKSLLPMLDDFEHALENIRSAQAPETVVKGVQIVYEHVLGILRSHGVEQTRALGEKFDPALHRAIMTKPDPQQPDGVVLEEHRKGYSLNGHTIRPSEVIVNKIAQQPPAEPENDEVKDTE